jgi:hypothetical protein
VVPTVDNEKITLLGTQNTRPTTIEMTEKPVAEDDGVLRRDNLRALRARSPLLFHCRRTLPENGERREVSTKRPDVLSGLYLAGGTGNMIEWRCPRCVQVISADHIVQLVRDGMSHVDCRRPSDLNPEERALLFRYCWGHAAAQCTPCAKSFRYDAEARTTASPISRMGTWVEDGWRRV